MAELYVFDNAAESLVGLRDAILHHGEEVAPRGKTTLEIRNVTTVINDPTDCLMTGIGRNMSRKLAVMEALQLIGGFSDPHTMGEAAPNTKAFWNGGILSGAYGPRIRPQLDKAINRLVHDPLTRQAVVTVWDPLHDQQDGIKDIPCTVSFNWHLRNGELHQTTHMRSNDVWWGWTYDVVMFTQLQCTLANILGAGIGTYTHVVDSLHMYTSNVDDSLEVQLTDTPRIRLSGLSVSSRMADRAQLIFYGAGPYADIQQFTETEAWMYRVLHG